MDSARETRVYALDEMSPVGGIERTVVYLRCGHMLIVHGKHPYVGDAIICHRDHEIGAEEAFRVASFGA